MTLRVLDLFSGIGGFSLGLERAGMETVAFCEIDPFCRRVLAKHWPAVPIYKDVRALDYDGAVDVICGGFPCQPFSVSGQRRGEKDDRYLWPEMLRCIEKHQPAWVIGENVAGHIRMGLDQVLSDLEALNYTWRAFVIPACAVNAPHKRERLWIIAYSESWRARTNGNSYKAQGNQRSHQSQPARGITIPFARVWPAGGDTEPPICRADDGLSKELDALGNAVVPQIPEIIGRAILATY